MVLFFLFLIVRLKPFSDANLPTLENTCYALIIDGFYCLILSPTWIACCDLNFVYHDKSLSSCILGETLQYLTIYSIP